MCGGGGGGGFAESGYICQYVYGKPNGQIMKNSVFQ